MDGRVGDLAVPASPPLLRVSTAHGSVSSTQNTIPRLQENAKVVTAEDQLTAEDVATHTNYSVNECRVYGLLGDLGQTMNKHSDRAVRAGSWEILSLI